MSPLPGMEDACPQPKRSSASEEFEKVWKAYPRKVEKAACLRCCLTRVANGHTWAQLLIAATNYCAECVRLGTEERYIKHGSRFFGRDEPWKDYMTHTEDRAGEHPFVAAARKAKEDRFGDHV